MLTVMVWASLTLPELSFDGGVVVETALDTLKVRSGRLFTVEMDGALAAEGHPGNRLEDGGLDGGVFMLVWRLPPGGEESVDCELPEPTGLRAMEIGEREAIGFMVFSAGGDGTRGFRDADVPSGLMLSHMEIVSVGLLVKCSGEVRMLPTLPCLDVVSNAVDEVDNDLLLALPLTLVSLSVTKLPSSCLGTHS